MTAGRTLWPAPFLDQRGNRRAGLPILVYKAGKGPEPDGDGTLEMADLFTDDALTVPRDQLTNPVTTDAAGNETAIKAAPGVYDAYVGGETIRFAIVDPNLSGTFMQSPIFHETTAATVILDLSDGKPRRFVTLESDTTLAVIHDDDQPIFLVIIDTGAGGFGLRWWAGINWAGGFEPTVSPTANRRDVFSFIRLGADDYLGFVVGQDLTAPTVPAAPLDFVATAVSATEISLAWTAPPGAGPSYTIERSTTGGGAGFAPIATGVFGTTYSDTTLSTGQHRWYRVIATTAAGAGPASAEADATTWTVPAQPTGAAAVAGNTTASVAWTPGSDGGGPVTGSVITPYIGGVAQTPQTLGASSPQVVTGLSNGTTYTFTVALTNVVGTGAASSASNSVVPFALVSPAAWFRPESLTGSNNSPIPSWADDGSKATPAVQATGSRQPLTKTNVLNGFSAAEFDGVDDTMPTGFWGTAIAQPFTAFFVARAFDLTVDGRFGDGATENQMIVGSNGSVWYIYGGGGIIYHNPFGSVNMSWHIFVGTFDSTSTKIRVDGGAGDGGASSNTLQGLTLGSGGSGSSDFLHSQIAEVVVIPSSSLTDINGWGAALATKFGLSWTTAT